MDCAKPQAVGHIHWRFGGVLLRSVMLMLLAGVVAVSVNALSPTGISLMGTEAFALDSQAVKAGLEVVSLDQTKRLVEQGEYVVLDARLRESFVEGHIPGALSLPVQDFDQQFAALQILLTPEQPVIVYCSGQTCDESLRLGELLRQQQIERVVLFIGGMEAWLEAGLDVEAGY